MARLFDDAQSEYLQIDQAVLTGLPLAMVCFFNTNDMASSQTLMNIVDKNVEDQGFFLFLHTSIDIVAAGSYGGDWSHASSSISYSVNTWHHACGLFVSDTDRRAFIDGGSKGTDATDITPVGLDRTCIGRNADSSPNNYMSGMIAEAAIWDLTNWPGATNADKADNFEKILPSLAKGFSPLFFPLGLSAYWPLIR